MENRIVDVFVMLDRVLTVNALSTNEKKNDCI